MADILVTRRFFDQEPQVHPELKKLTGRVVLTPHIGSASIDTRLEMARWLPRT